MNSLQELRASLHTQPLFFHSWADRNISLTNKIETNLILESAYLEIYVIYSKWPHIHMETQDQNRNNFKTNTNDSMIV